MPRPPRLHVPGGFYHVVLRGNHREALFSTAADRGVLNEIVADAAESARVHAFCWMSNHLHMLLQVADEPLGAIMQRIAMRYARHRHKRMQTTGHLFERRYKAQLIDSDAYFLTALRYIHLNPVAANIVADPAHYPWSSHSAYLGVERVAWVTTEFGLSLFGADRQKARLSYAKFINKETHESDSAMQTHIDSETKPAGLQDQLFATTPAVSPRQHRPRSSQTLEELANQVCLEYHITIDRLRSPSRARELTPIRLDFITRATHFGIATATQLACFLHRDPSALTRLVARHTRRPQVRS